MRQSKLSLIFWAIRLGLPIQGWTGSRQSGSDFVERFSPSEIWERKHATGVWEMVKPLRGNL